MVVEHIDIKNLVTATHEAAKKADAAAEKAEEAATKALNAADAARKIADNALKRWFVECAIEGSR